MKKNFRPEIIFKNFVKIKIVVFSQMSGSLSAEFQEKRADSQVVRLLEGGWGPKGGCDFPKKQGGVTFLF